MSYLQSTARAQGRDLHCMLSKDMKMYVVDPHSINVITSNSSDQNLVPSVSLRNICL